MRTTTAGGNGLARRLSWAAAAMLLATGAVARAQDQVLITNPETQGRYFSTGWLFMLTFTCALWMIAFDWIGRDTERLKGRRGFWGGMILGVGGTGVILMLLVDMALSFASVLGIVVVFGIYVWRRNAGLPPEQQVFTRQHFRYLMRAAMEKLKLRESAGAMMQKGEREGAVEIELLRKDGASLEKLSEGRTHPQASEAVLAVKELIESAVLSRTTDVHLEPKETELQARFRIDGILHNVPSYPQELALPMVSGVNVLSDMDIAEKRKPQDGTFMGRLGERTLDFRVATTPSVHGETMVIRILDRDVGLMRLDRLGLQKNMLRKIGPILNAANGMLIASGPTGSGKTTTMYAMISEMDAYQKNIVTVENPIEYRLDNVTQTQVNPKAGVTFPGTLRSFLRQDPDVILVGEIRDAETARVALQAAMTGHFVLTTLHANDAITSLFRLLDLGVEPYLISSSLSAVLGQRLVRVLCTACKQPYAPPASFLKKIGVKPTQDMVLYKAQGCEECQGTGYRGRKGVFDFFEATEAVKELIRVNPSPELIKQEARKSGWRTLQEAGLSLVIEGHTSLKELVRVTR